MLNNDKNAPYIFAGMAFLTAWAWQKMRAIKDNGTEVSDCISGITDGECKTIAAGIKEVFDSNLFYWDADEQEIIAQFRRIDGACAYRKVFSYFGTLDSITRGDGDLDFWMAKLTTETRNACKTFCGGLANF